MIRERVSTRGVIRPLEPESELIPCNMPEAIIGYLSERAIRRYLDSAAVFDKKFARHAKAIERQRLQNLERAEKETRKSFEVLEDRATKQSRGTKTGVPPRLTPAELNRRWAWALDKHERPPPSSIVARRDTKERQKLAEIADRSILPGERFLSGNNFWSLLVNFFTNAPDRSPSAKEKSP